MTLDLRPTDRQEVDRILKSFLPEFTVWVFGSRITGHAKPYSDLDLALITDEPLSFERLAMIKEAFDESDLSIRVDIVDWAAASRDFQQIISQHKIVLQQP